MQVWEQSSSKARVMLEAQRAEDEIIARAATKAILAGTGRLGTTATQVQKNQAQTAHAVDTAHASEMVYSIIPSHNHFVDEEPFHEFIRSAFNILSSRAHELLTEIWNAVNPDMGEYVPWKALFSGLAQVMAGTLDDKASFYFSLHDGDGSGDMDKSEVCVPDAGCGMAWFHTSVCFVLSTDFGSHLEQPKGRRCVCAKGCHASPAAGPGWRRSNYL